jgi:hypothetical protein
MSEMVLCSFIYSVLKILHHHFLYSLFRNLFFGQYQKDLTHYCPTFTKMEIEVSWLSYFEWKDSILEDQDHFLNYTMID